MLVRLFATALLFTSLVATATSAELSDAEIRAILIKQSQASYSGNCPCPYNVDRVGRSCGARSAYTKPGGAEPLCYPHDVTPEMIAQYKRANF